MDDTDYDKLIADAREHFDDKISLRVIFTRPEIDKCGGDFDREYNDSYFPGSDFIFEPTGLEDVRLQKQSFAMYFSKGTALEVSLLTAFMNSIKTRPGAPEVERERVSHVLNDVVYYLFPGMKDHFPFFKHV